jgi:hypothetical protein
MTREEESEILRGWGIDPRALDRGADRAIEEGS